MEEDKKFRVIVSDMKDPRGTVDVLAGHFGIPAGRAGGLLTSLPAVVGRDLLEGEAEKLRKALSESGASVEVKAILVPKRCQTHPDKLITGKCASCDQPVCDECLKASHGKGLCPKCTEEIGAGKIRFPYRKALAILAFLIVLVYAASVLYRERSRFAWKRPLKVAIIAFMVDLPPNYSYYIERFMEETGKEYVDFDNHTLPDMEGWFQQEHERYGGTVKSVLEIQIFGPYNTTTPPPSPIVEGGFFKRYAAYKKFKAYFKEMDKREGLDPGEFDARIYVQFVRGRYGGISESYASRREMLGLANCFLDPRAIENNLMVILHELGHVLGATDHYDEAGLPIFPDGYADTGKEPLLPQDKAELMAGRIPISEGSAEEVQNLGEVMIGPKTAREIGWISKKEFRNLTE